MLDGVTRTRAAIVADQNVREWFRLVADAALAALDRCVDWQAATAAGIGKKPWVIRETTAAARGAVRDLRAVLVDAQTGYRVRLVDRIVEQCRQPTLSTPDWLRFDRELRLIATLALTEGRSETRLGDSIARAIARASDSDEAILRLRAALEGPTTEFVVAFSIEGVRQPKHLRRFGLREVSKRRPITWRSGETCPADDALVSFYASRAANCTVVTTEIAAHDVGQAANIAWQRGERVADQFGAEHRVYRISVVSPLLVLHAEDGAVFNVKTSPRPEYLARARLRGPEARLEQSLRYAALARAERAPVVQILHSWIALETLARGTGAPSGPYQLLMHNLAPALSIHAVRQSLAATWQIASRANRRGPNNARWTELERWLGINGRHRNLGDLSKWVDLMRHQPARGTLVPSPLTPDATLDEAGQLLLELLPEMVPFVREAILRWRWRLAIGNRLSNWCDEIRTQAESSIGRMYVTRNATVHAALTEAPGGNQLAHAASNIVDTVYEVVPAWLEDNRPTWRAFERLRRRAAHLHRTWNHLPQPALLDAET